MTVLAHQALRDLLGDDAAIGPSSADLHLGDRLIRLPYGVTIDPERDQSDLWQDVPLREDGRWMIGQGALYLGVTAEPVAVPGDMLALLHGISSLGRMGLLVHVTAGLVDSGWRGNLTLELVSLGGSILLRPGQRIAQVTYHRLSSLTDRPYVGKYLEDQEPTPSRMFLEAEAAP